MTTDLSNIQTLMGHGSVRFPANDYLGEEELRRVAQKMLEIPSISDLLQGPILLCRRGKRDIRLEYVYEIQDNQDLIDRFYRLVHTLVESCKLPISGKWHHSHTTGIEMIS